MLADALHSTFPSAVASLGYLYVPLVEQFPCLHFALFILSSRLQPTRRQVVELVFLCPQQRCTVQRIPLSLAQVRRHYEYGLVKVDSDSDSITTY